jgi:hypothetical protein
VAEQTARQRAAASAAASVQAELPGPFSPGHERDVAAYEDGTLSARELYARAVARWAPRQGTSRPAPSRLSG